MRLQSFDDFQGTGWKLASFLLWSSNVVIALANGARGARQLVSGDLQQKPGKVAAVSGASKTSKVDISAPRNARTFLTADLNTWQGRLQN